MPARLRLIRLIILPVVLLSVVTGPKVATDSFGAALFFSAGTFLLVVAAGGRAWASLYLAGKKNETLVTDGPYSIVRNPLYLFSLIGFVGTGLAFGSVSLAIAFAAVFFITHWPTIHAEERTLAKRFGTLFERYREVVPRFFPSFRTFDHGETVPVNPRKFALALRECMAIPLVLILVELVRWAQESNLLPIVLTLP